MYCYLDDLQTKSIYQVLHSIERPELPPPPPPNQDPTTNTGVYNCILHLISWSLECSDIQLLHLLQPINSDTSIINFLRTFKHINYEGETIVFTLRQYSSLFTNYHFTVFLFAENILSNLFKINIITFNYSNPQMKVKKQGTMNLKLTQAAAQ